MTSPAHDASSASSPAPRQVLAAVNAMRHRTPAQTATALGMSLHDVARALTEAGAPDRAAVFRRAGRRSR